MTDELKPCPFCPDGGKPLMLDFSDTMHIVKCTKCGCVTGNLAYTIELAAQNWNTRSERTCHAIIEDECLVCSECQEDIDPSWVACPYCGCEISGAEVIAE